MIRFIQHVICVRQDVEHRCVHIGIRNLLLFIVCSFFQNKKKPEEQVWINHIVKPKTLEQWKHCSDDRNLYLTIFNNLTTYLIESSACFFFCTYTGNDLLLQWETIVMSTWYCKLAIICKIFFLRFQVDNFFRRFGALNPR